MTNLSAVEIDKKPFKGKGTSDWLASEERRYEKIIKEMQQLSADSKLSGGRNYYLMLNYRNISHQYFLRWRSYGTRHIHLTWAQMVPAVKKMSEALRVHFIEANDRIELLNAQEMATRFAMRLARNLVNGDSGNS